MKGIRKQIKPYGRPNYIRMFMTLLFCPVEVVRYSCDFLMMFCVGHEPVELVGNLLMSEDPTDL